MCERYRLPDDRKSSNVPRIIDRLLVKKLVKRAPSREDKRETLISLTDDGLKQVESSNILVDAMQQRIIGLDESEATLLSELLEKMRTTD